MGINVFANGRGISCKANSNKSIAAMPDVCLSPPSPPAGPVPIPYPNFSQASKTSSGSKKVKIGGKEVGLKNKSDYKKSKGNLAATRNFGMGVVTHKLEGKTKHAAWSFNVKIEKQNVIRHLDMTTHNHGSVGNTLSNTVDAESMAKEPEKSDCEELDEKNKEEREFFEEAEWEDNGEIIEITDKQSDKLSGKSTTITHGKFKPSRGYTRCAVAHNNALANKKDNRYLKGLDKKKRKKGKSNLCEKARFKYKRPTMQTTGHTESRIVEDIFSRNPGGEVSGTLLLNISLKKRSGQISRLPCSHCHRLLCASKKCGLKIYLCDNSNQPKELTNDCCPKDTRKRVPKKLKKNLKKLLGEEVKGR
jgi:hypothetical protein